MKHGVQVIESQFPVHWSTCHRRILSQGPVYQVEHLEGLSVQVFLGIPPKGASFYPILFLGMDAVGCRQEDA